MTENNTTWKVLYENEDSNDTLDEWWEVTDDVSKYKCSSESHADYLANHLNKTGFEIPYSDIGMPSETFKSIE